MARELAERQRKWEKEGWSISHTKSGHLKAIHPGGANHVIIAKTASDHRAFLNVEAEMRRSLEAGTGSQPIQLQKKSSPRPSPISNTEPEPVFLTIEEEQKQEYLNAWKIAYVRMRMAAISPIGIRSAKMRYRTDRAFADLIINAYKQFPKTETAELLTAFFGGCPKPSAFRAALSVTSIEEIATGKSKPDNTYVANREKFLEETVHSLQNKLKTLEDDAAKLKAELESKTAALNIAQSENRRLNEAVNRQAAKARVSVHALRDGVAKLFSETLQELNTNTRINTISINPDVEAKHTVPPSVERRDMTPAEEIAFVKGELPVVSAPFQAEPKAEPKAAPKSRRKQPDNDTLGSRLRSARTKMGMSQNAVALEIGNIHCSMISHFEMNRYIPSDMQLKMYASLLKTTVKYLKTGKK